MTHSTVDWKQYYRNVIHDFVEVKTIYPFSRLSILPTVIPKQATIRTVAVNKDFINAVKGVENDFINEFSKELYIVIPADYRRGGCLVYGAKWFDKSFFRDEDIHFYLNNKHLIEAPHRKWGYRMCVGVPESFILMRNPILECIRTAENMLIAYERVMTGHSEKLELIAYAHGKEGERQFHTSKSKYITLKGNE